jgi:hypothetical protein
LQGFPKGRPLSNGAFSFAENRLRLKFAPVSKKNKRKIHKNLGIRNMDTVGIEIFFTKPFQKHIHFIFSISPNEEKANKKVSVSDAIRNRT